MSQTSLKSEELPANLLDAIPPSITQGLTDMQLGFVVKYIELGGEDPELAAAQAGYSTSVAKSTAYDLLRRPQIQEAIRHLVLNLFASDAVAARKVMVDLMRDTRTPAAVRRQAAMNVLHMARLDPGHTINVNKRSFQSFNIQNLDEAERRMFEKLFARVTGEVIEGELDDGEEKGEKERF